MAIDFSALDDSDSFDTEVSPRLLFDLAPDKDREKYKYPRDVQSEVMDRWMKRRKENDLLIKMNTGGGKTIVGLLLLKSSLNEGAGPAVYIAPTPYLAQQVTDEAKAFGIEVTDDPRSAQYASGQAILVANIFKLINGKSVFGVGDEGVKIKIGSIIIDDAHACLETSEEQFSLKADVGTPIYDKLFKLFAKELERQSESRFLDVKDHRPGRVMEVPFWAWSDKQSEVLKAIRAERDEEHVKFIWPLIQEHLRLCRCVFGSGEIEITPRCLPVSVIHAFSTAKRRIYMSATFSDDSVLVTDFNVPPHAVEHPITPTRANDLGDRMILVPQSVNPDIADDDLKELVAKLGEKHNTVVIVPSDYRSNFWSDVADLKVTAANLPSAVRKLKRGHVGVVVFVNKYDGIDLPGDACRVLVIDGVPDVRKKTDHVDEPILLGSERMVKRAVQRVEQGMGRGVRDIEDHCVVFVMGRSLVSLAYTATASQYFTPGTRAQMRISEKIAKQLAGKSTKDVAEAAEQCLRRDKSWIKVSRGALKDVVPATGGKVDDVAKAQREAFDQAHTGAFKEAMSAMEDVANAETDPKVKGWLKQETAVYEQFRNPTQAQHILKAAVKLNPHVLRPIAGIEYERLALMAADQATGCLEYLRTKYDDPNQFVLDIKALIEKLEFKEDTSNPFEQAIADVARYIGFNSQRPDNDTGKGPDDLWSLGKLRFLVIECKNGATTAEIVKHDCDQLGGSVRWFEKQYDATCKKVPVIIHPSSTFEKHGTPPPDARVMTKGKLEELKAALEKFAAAATRLEKFGPSADLAKVLAHHKLNAESFVEAFTVKFKVGK